MTIIALTAFAKKALAWLKNYWYVPFSLAVVIVLVVLFKQDPGQIIKVLETAKKGYEKEKKIIAASDKKEQKSIDKIDKQKDKDIRALEEKKKLEDEEINKMQIKLEKELAKGYLKNDAIDDVLASKGFKKK